jgi:hypothetical protein
MKARNAPGTTMAQARDTVSDLGLHIGAGDGNRTRTISLGIQQIGVSDLTDLGTRHTVGDRDVPFDTGANGPPMARGPIASGTDQGPALLAARRWVSGGYRC